MCSSTTRDRRHRRSIEAPAVVAVQPHPFHYRPAGDFTRDGHPVNAPARTVGPDRAVTIMTHQVTDADYQRCALNNACPPAPSVAEALAKGNSRRVVTAQESALVNERTVV
jgi:formylglycine-generating enzyme required for sulfatase activity